MLKLTLEIEKEMCNLYISGLTLKEIGKLHEVSRIVIKRILKINNVVIRNQSQSMKLKSKYSVKEENMVCKMYLNGLSPNEIYEKTNITHSPIKRILKRNNIKLRTLSEACIGRCPDFETRKKLSDAKIGKPSNRRGIPASNGQKEKQRIVMTGKKIHTEKHKEELVNWTSDFFKKLWQEPGYKEKHSGENHFAWNGGTSFGIYCPKFNNSKREEIREKYNRCCIVCNKPEYKNLTKNNKIYKLSVHHIDYNKLQCCEGHEWRLAPLCMSCHNKTNKKESRKYWEDKVKEILQNLDKQAQI